MRCEYLILSSWYCLLYNTPYYVMWDSVSTLHSISTNKYCIYLCAYRLKSSVCLDKPVFIGVTILELSKFLMFSYYYQVRGLSIYVSVLCMFCYSYMVVFQVLKPCYGERVVMLYTDTDSLVISISSDNITADLQRVAQTMDSKGALFKFKVNNSVFLLLLLP